MFISRVQLQQLEMTSSRSALSHQLSNWFIQHIQSVNQKELMDPTYEVYLKEISKYIFDCKHVYDTGRGACQHQQSFLKLHMDN